MKLEKITNVITDFVSNGSFKSLNDNVNYLNNKTNAYARLIRLTDFNNNYSEENAIYVSEHSFNFLKKSNLKYGDLIISNVGANLGTVFKCPKLSIKMTLGPNAILIRANSQYTSNNYLYYLFLSMYGQEKLLSLTSGSAMPKFSKTDLRNLDISIHNLKLQQHIVNIHRRLDYEKTFRIYHHSKW
ncbi:restriction endonuclease subunit S [Mycoplasma sp. 1232]|uniref:restriction endonuclease subunit S n=1 Tax=Mycoplasma sp. 1232 TaxID=3108527 RepID=UPI002B25AAC5|nr:restriction endonuclease subunit S [Mycoplasma sp. 1232]MEA4333850.1 restriction endonuclease subunit S [Mycoplasma sp. 1232]